MAPELEIATEYLNTFFTNFILWQTFGLNHTNPNLEEDQIYITFQQEMDIAANTAALVDLVAGKLLGGEISDTLRTEVGGMVDRLQPTDTALRAAEAIYLITTSPEFAYQR